LIGRVPILEVMAPNFDRAFYRLVYPLTARPRLRLGPHPLEVLDLSEEGVRLLWNPALQLVVGEGFEGTIDLPSGPSLPIEGMVLWVDLPRIGARLIQGVPFSVMLEEQRYIQRRFAARR
jgi:hypothetical protein